MRATTLSSASEHESQMCHGALRKLFVDMGCLVGRLLMQFVRCTYGYGVAFFMFFP